MVCVGPRYYDVVSFRDDGTCHTVRKFDLGADIVSAGVTSRADVVVKCSLSGTLTITKLDEYQTRVWSYSLLGPKCVVKPGPEYCTAIAATLLPSGGYTDFNLYSLDRQDTRVATVLGWDTAYITNDGLFVVGYKASTFRKTKKRAAHSEYFIHVVRTSSAVTETSRQPPVATWECPRALPDFQSIEKIWYIAVAHALVILYKSNEVDVVFRGRATRMDAVHHIDVDADSGVVLCVMGDDLTFHVGRFTTDGLVPLSSGRFRSPVSELALIPVNPKIPGVHCYVNSREGYVRVQVSATCDAIVADAERETAAQRSRSAATGLTA